MKQLANVLSVYAVSSIISRSAPLLMLPIMTSYLSPFEYGMFAVFITISVAVAPLLLWGGHYYLSVEYFYRERDDFYDLLWSVLAIPFILFPLLLILFLGFGYFGILFELDYIYFILIPVSALLGCPLALIAVLLRVSGRPKSFAFIEVLNTLVQVCFSYLFVVYINGGLAGRIEGFLAGGFIVFLVTLYIYVRASPRCNFKKSTIFNVFKYGVSIAPYEIGNGLGKSADRFLLLFVLGGGSVGVYSVAAQIAGVAQIAISVFTLAWQPFLFDKLRGGANNSRLLVFYSWGFILVFFVGAALSMFVIPYVYKYFVGKGYHSSLSYFGWFSAAYFFVFIQALFTDYILFKKKAKYLSLIVFVNLLCFSISGVCFIGLYGEAGAAMAFCCSSAVSMLMAMIIAYKLSPMPWFCFFSRA